jgi:ferrous iron transport protein A
MELGLVPGTEVVITKVAPMGDPLEIAVRGGRLSIRQQEASALMVEVPEDHAQVA